MRKLEYLSPSSIAAWLKDQQEFYLTYLSEIRAPRFAQTQPMAIGSAFDAYVKSFLHEALIGKDPKFELRTLFEKQVEPHNRSWAWDHGKYAFQCYKDYGALGDIMVDLQQSKSSPRFEFDITGKIDGHFGNVMLLGKPDVFYMNREGCHVILDFKVNGWCGANTTSPKPGYIRIRSHGASVGAHKNCFVQLHRGMLINCGSYFEDIEKDWARQLTIYALLCGAELGSDFIVAVDQFACKPESTYPNIRIAQHRAKISPGFQQKVMIEAENIWEIINSNHIFRDMSLEESQQKCEFLDKRANQLKNPKTEEDVLFNRMTR